MEIYRKVKCSDRLPEIDAENYHTDLGICTFIDGKFESNNLYGPEYWLEPVKLPTEDEIETAALNRLKP